MASQLKQEQFRYAVTIASGAAVSGSVTTAGRGPRGIGVLTPSAWTAADIGFEVSADGTNFYPVYDKSGARVKITSVATGAAQYYVAPPECWGIGAWDFMRIVSLNTATGANANQAAARACTVVFLS